MFLSPQPAEKNFLKQLSKSLNPEMFIWGNSLTLLDNMWLKKILGKCLQLWDAAKTYPRQRHFPALDSILFYSTENSKLNYNKMTTSCRQTLYCQKTIHEKELLESSSC